MRDYQIKPTLGVATRKLRPRNFAKVQRISKFQQPVTIKTLSGAGFLKSQTTFPVLPIQGRYGSSSASIARSAVLQLQHTHGNRYVQRLLQSARKPEDESMMPSDLEGTIENTRGGGHALDSSVRETMGRVFKTDFSPVRVHTNSQADLLARSLNARAFTTGKDIYFKQGEYNPGGSGGKELLAHELTHVVQQHGDNISSKNEPIPSFSPLVGAKPIFRNLTVGRPDDIYEKEADRVAAVFSRREQVLGPAGNKDKTQKNPLPGNAGEATKAASRDAGGPANPLKRQFAGTCGGTCSTEDVREDDVTPRRTVPAQRVTLGPRRSGLPVVQRKRMQVGDLDVDFVPRAVFEIAFQAPAGRITARRGILIDNNGHGVAQLARDEEAVGLSLSFAISWQSGSRRKPPPPGIPPELLALCNPCLILESRTIRDILRFARKSIRDMAKDCRNRETFAERRDFVRTFLQLISGDPCLLIEESPIKVSIFGIELGVFQACRVASFIPVVSSIVRGISSGINTGFDLLNNLPAEQVCNNVPIIDPPDPNRPAARGNATVVFNTRFVPNDGITGFGPPPITNQSGTGATIEQPVASGRQKIGDRGVNVHLAPALLRVGAQDRGQDLADIDVLLAAPPTPIDYSCRERFGPFRVNFDRFEDEPSQLVAIHRWFHGLHPRTKQDLANGKGRVNIVGRASRTGSFDFNMKLSEKRAKRVEEELRRAAGSDSHLRTSATGFLAAVEEGEAANERRADVEAVGTLEGDAALEVETAEGACVGGSVADTLSPTTAEGGEVPAGGFEDFLQIEALPVQTEEPVGEGVDAPATATSEEFDFSSIFEKAFA